MIGNQTSTNKKTIQKLKTRTQNVLPYTSTDLSAYLKEPISIKKLYHKFHITNVFIEDCVVYLKAFILSNKYCPMISAI